MKLALFVLMLVPIVPSLARAQRPLPAGCKGKTQLALDECAAARNADAEAELAKLYEAMQRADSGTSVKMLRQSQREWRRFRDAHCRWIASQWEGGTIQPMYYSLCLERVARARIRQLRADTADLGVVGGDYPQ